jgi:RNA-binding protein
MQLTTKQKAFLRGLGQSLRPQLQLGHQGYSEGVLSALEDLFRRRELVKVRVLKTAEDDPRAVAETLAQNANATVVGVVGQNFVLYRPNPELKERIELPETGKPDPPRPIMKPGRRG